MARKLGIVMGNGRRSTPLTERKLEPEEIVGGHGHSPRDLCKPYRCAASVPPAPVCWKEAHKGGNELGYLPHERESRKGTKRKGWRDHHVNPPPRGGRDRRVGLLLSIPDPFFIFLFLSLLLELRAETVRGIKLTSSTC